MKDDWSVWFKVFKLSEKRVADRICDMAFSTESRVWMRGADGVDSRVEQNVLDRVYIRATKELRK